MLLAKLLNVVFEGIEVLSRNMRCLEFFSLGIEHFD